MSNKIKWVEILGEIRKKCTEGNLSWKKNNYKPQRIYLKIIGVTDLLAEIARELISEN